MKKTHLVIAASLVVAGATWAAGPDLSKLPPAADKQGVTYEKDIRPLFEASCNRCHGEQRQRGELRLDTLAAVLKGGENGKILTPGNSRESGLVIAVAQIDEEKAMPPKRGGRRGSPGAMVAGQMLSQGDKNGDKQLSKEEFAALADAWFGKLDPDKTGKVSQQQFTERFGSLLPAPQRAGRGPGGAQPGQPGQAGQPGGQPGARPEGEREGQRGGERRGGFNPGRLVGAGFFAAADTDKDGSVTREEWKNLFAKWFADWDTDKSGSLTDEKLRAGLTKALPQPNFPGRGGPGGPEVAGGPGGQKGPGNAGAPEGQKGPGGPGGQGGQPSKPLTPEQVSLVRAWIDQGAK